MAQFLASNQALGFVLIAVLAALGWWQRTAVQEVLQAPNTAWRVLAWAAFGMMIALILWCTFADDWRKIFGELLDWREQYLSQRAVLNPVAPGIRRITVLLLVPALLLAGALFARYIGGYGLQLTLLILGVSAFFPIYLMRQRLDTGVAGILDLPSFFSLGMLATLFYFLLDYATNVTLILTSYLGLLGLVAIPVTIVLDLLGRREPPARPDATTTAFYAKIRDRVETRRAAEPTTGRGETNALQPEPEGEKQAH